VSWGWGVCVKPRERLMLASFIARKNASIRPPTSPRAGAVCNNTVPSATDASYATLNVTTVSTAAITRSDAQCCDLQTSSRTVTQSAKTQRLTAAHKPLQIGWRGRKRPAPPRMGCAAQFVDGTKVRGECAQSMHI